MKITELRYYKNPDRVKRKVLLDTYRLGRRVKEFYDSTNDRVDRKLDRLCSKLVDFLG
jgi:hypothetical protein